MFAGLTDLVGEASGWAYVAVALLTALDSLLPLVPSEGIVVTGGTLAARGDLAVVLVALAAAIGAWCGDVVLYLAGRRLGPRVTRALNRRENMRRRVQWAERQLQRRGAKLIVVSRFLPGGRTAVTLAAGLLHYPTRRFLMTDAVATALWGTYMTGLGYFGGQAFDDPWLGIALALSLALVVGLLIEIGRRIRRGRARRAGTGAQWGRPSSIH